jgi:hypothetical protein
MGSLVPYGHRNTHYDVEKHMAHFVIFKQSIWRERKRSQNLTKPYRIFKYTRSANNSTATFIEVSLNSLKLLFTLTRMV